MSVVLGVAVQAHRAEASGSRILDLTHEEASIQAGPYLTALEDCSGKLTVRQVDELARSGGLRQFRQAEPSYGYSSCTYWFRLQLRDNALPGRDWLITLDNPRADTFELHELLEGRPQVMRSGNQVQIPDRTIRSRYPAFALGQVRGQVRTLYLRAQTTDIAIFPVVVTEREEFYRVGQREQMLLGIYFGLLAFAALFNSLVFAHTREATYLICSLLIACFSFYQAAVNAVDLEYLWPDRRDWNVVGIPLFCGLSAMAASVFAWRFLELSNRAPRLRIMMFVMVGAGGTAVVGVALGGVTLGGLLGSIAAPVTVTGLAVMGAVSFLRGCRHAGYLLLAGVLELAGLTLDGLHKFGILPRTFLTAYGDETGGALFIIVVSLALTARFNAIRRDRLAAERIASESLRRAAEAKLQALQAKINPHFLFNALTTIAGLVREAPERAEVTIVKLARLFRYTLTATEQPQVPLSEELAVVRSYLEIEQARFGDKLEFEIQTEGSVEGLTLPGLTLQPLVENSVKHGLRPKSGGGKVVVRVRNAGEYYHLTVEDDGVGMGDSQHQEGHGLANVRERLRLAYGGRAWMALSHGLGLRVEIGLPVRVDT